MGQNLLPLDFDRSVAPRESRGAVYTKPWVVSLLLDLAGYSPETNLVDSVSIEPAAGEGAFLIQMAQRLIASCRRLKRPLEDCCNSIIAYEIDESSAEAARGAVIRALRQSKIPERTATRLGASWIRTGDYLLEASRLPKADFVLGNPPYIRLEDIPDEMLGLYRNAYPTMRGRADLYVGFFEASLRVLKPWGVCSFICADRWMLNQYGAELRSLVTASFSVEAVVEMHNADAFDDDVNAYPAITVIRRAAQKRALVASLGPESGDEGGARLAKAYAATTRSEGLSGLPAATVATVESWFSGSDPWPCASPKRLALLRQIEEQFNPLESAETGTKVGIGVATGCDGIFITRDKNLVEPTRLLPLALASDTMSGHLTWSGHYLVDPWNCKGLVDLNEYPRLRAYVEKNRKVLTQRHTAKKNVTGWFRTIDRVSHSLTSKPKLYIPDIKNMFNPVLDEGRTYPHHNLYVVTSEKWNLEVLGGILLSGIGRLFIESYGVRMRGGYFRFQAQYLRRIRVPNPASIDRKAARKLVQAFQDRNRDLATEVACPVYGIGTEKLEAALGH